MTNVQKQMLDIFREAPGGSSAGVQASEGAVIIFAHTVNLQNEGREAQEDENKKACVK